MTWFQMFLSNACSEWMPWESIFSAPLENVSDDAAPWLTREI